VRATAGDWLFVGRLLRRGWVHKNDVTPLRRKRRGWRTWFARRRFQLFPEPLPGTLRQQAALRRKARRAGRRNRLAVLAKGTKVTILGAKRRFVKVKTASGQVGFVLRRQVRTSKPVPKRNVFASLMRAWRAKLGKVGGALQRGWKKARGAVRRGLGKAKSLLKRGASKVRRALRRGAAQARSAVTRGLAKGKKLLRGAGAWVKRGLRSIFGKSRSKSKARKARSRATRTRAARRTRARRGRRKARKEARSRRTRKHR